jgi:ABC-type molybdenum transport system ATPase subunit/photorepair protein PhrA
MKATYRSFFGLQKEPFGSDLPIEDIPLTRELSEVTQRFEYTLRIGGVGVLTGEIGSGKSTALRYASAKLHPAEYASLYLTATTGSILETYRQILTELGIEKSSASKATLTGLIRQAVIELVEAKKMKSAFYRKRFLILSKSQKTNSGNRRERLLSKWHHLQPTCELSHWYPGRSFYPSAYPFFENCILHFLQRHRSMALI